MAWAYAVLLTSPIVVTVGLSTTIPLSLIGQIFINSQHASYVYWLGACVVLLSFFFVNHEEGKEDDETPVSDEEQVPLEGPPSQ
jgi:solute carrier family 35 protein F5